MFDDVFCRKWDVHRQRFITAGSLVILDPSIGVMRSTRSRVVRYPEGFLKTNKIGGGEKKWHGAGGYLNNVLCVPKLNGSRLVS